MKRCTVIDRSFQADESESGDGAPILFENDYVDEENEIEDIENSNSNSSLCAELSCGSDDEERSAGWEFSEEGVTSSDEELDVRRSYSNTECASCGKTASKVGFSAMKITCNKKCGAHFCSITCFKASVDGDGNKGRRSHECWKGTQVRVLRVGRPNPRPGLRGVLT